MIKTISNNFHLFSKESGQRHIHSSLLHYRSKPVLMEQWRDNAMKTCSAMTIVRYNAMKMKRWWYCDDALVWDGYDPVYQGILFFRLFDRQKWLLNPQERLEIKLLVKNFKFFTLSVFIFVTQSEMDGFLCTHSFYNSCSTMCSNHKWLVRLFLNKLVVYGSTSTCVLFECWLSIQKLFILKE